MAARLLLLFLYVKDNQIFYYSLLCIYTNCLKSVLSLNTGVLVTYLDCVQAEIFEWCAPLMSLYVHRWTQR